MPWVAMAIGLAFSAGQPPLEGWVRFSVGPPAGEVRTCLGHITIPFEVESTPRGAVVVRQETATRDSEFLPLSPTDVSLPQETNRHSVAVEDGWLVGFDAGEFGGGLWSVRADGQRVTVPLDNVPAWAGNVHALLATPAGPLAFVGLTHLSAEHGAVLRCIRRSGRWATKLVTRTDGTPTAAAAETDGGVVFVTGHGIGRVSPSGTVRMLLRSDFDGLYPSSIVTDARRNIYVGMRGVVVRLRVEAQQEDWLVPPGCIRFELAGRRCTCLP